MQTQSKLGNCRADTVEVYRQAVERTIDSMEDHLADDFSLEDMARIGYMSPYHFNRVFRQVTGVPPVRFLGARRLEMAKRLLLTTSMSVTDVCFEVGYNSLGTFTRRFTDLMGVPPNRFRALAEGISAEAGQDITEEAVEVGPGRAGIRGRVRVDEDFDGLIFVGLFKTAIPQGRPVACAILVDGGAFRLPMIADGRYHLFAIGLPWSTDPKHYLLYEDALRGGYPNQFLTVEDGVVEGETELELRPPEPFDPPILMTFPLLIRKRLQRLFGVDREEAVRLNDPETVLQQAAV